MPSNKDTERFKVVDGSQSGHCCFKATVVDTTKPVMIRGVHFKNQFEVVCETFDFRDAIYVAKALNAKETTNAAG